MSDLSSLLMPQTFPDALVQVRDAFAAQPDRMSCGAAALRHGLLLGGLLTPVHTLVSLLEIHDNWGTGDETLLTALQSLGFEVEQRTKLPTQSTADFLSELDQLAEGGFLLPCLRGGWHWVCMGAWDGERAWVIDSCYGYEGRLEISGWTAQEFDHGLRYPAGRHRSILALGKWANCINVVRPGSRWAKQYQDWLPARRALLRMPVNASGANSVTMEAAVTIAAHQYLNDAEYTAYFKLGLYLPGGVEVTLQVEDPGAHAVLVGAEGEGEGPVLVFRRAAGMLTGPIPPAQTPPELVIRAGQLLAAQLR